METRGYEGCRKVPAEELKNRMARFRRIMDQRHTDWRLAIFAGRINMYYFTGTIQDGFPAIPRDDEAVFWVRKSHDRALDESLFPVIRPMRSYRDAAQAMGSFPCPVHMETELVPLAMYQRMQKYFGFTGFLPLDAEIMAVRSVKSPYEISCMRRSGEIHRIVLEDRVPHVLREGMSEAELSAILFNIMMEEGYHGVTRFGMFNTEMVLGQIGFGESSIYPSYFDGPGGHIGLSPAVPTLGNRERRLNKGDLVFVDIGCGVDGYHTDKTMIYMFGQRLPDHAIEIHERCVAIQDEIASRLKPGAIPSEIYNETMSGLEPDFLENFMGFGNRTVKFLGHGIGLAVDELPVIARGFDEPIQEGMAFALEPKKGIAGVGMVGIENTFIVTADGSECITGAGRGLIPVY